jgi:cysteine desulfurase / selenocysteine lyase
MTGAALDVARARRETPGCRTVVHFNNAGAALVPTRVRDAVIDHLQRESEIGGYEAAAERHDQVEHTYDALARLLHCQRDEIAIVDSGTRAWDAAFYAFGLNHGDRILTTEAEYASNYIALRQVATRTGASVDVIPNDASGQVDVEALRRMLDETVRLVSLVHVPTQSGLVNPAAAVGAVTRRAGVALLLDACQSIGQMPIDVAEIGCDILSAAGRKFLRGPRGTGLLYVRRGLIEHLEPPFLDLHAAEWLADGSYRIRSDARRFESWEANVATKIGLGVAADYALEWGLESIHSRVVRLAAQLRQRLADLPGVIIRDQGQEQCAIVTFTVTPLPAPAVADALAAERINVSVSPAAYSRLDLEKRGLEAVVRASLHYYNDDTELDRFVTSVARITRRR